jgi:hypothetical protein
MRQRVYRPGATGLRRAHPLSCLEDMRIRRIIGGPGAPRDPFPPRPGWPISAAPATVRVDEAGVNAGDGETAVGAAAV